MDMSLAKNSMSAPAREVVHVLVELVKESVRPVIDIPFAVQMWTLHLCNTVSLGILPRPEKVQGNITWGQDTIPDCTPDAIQHMVAVRFQYHLYSSRSDFGQKPAHRRLPRGMKVYLGILDQQQIVRAREQGRDDDRKNLRESKAGVDGGVEVRGVRGAKSQRHGIGARDPFRD